MRVLVAGASGFIGSATLPRLLADGHSVVALSRNPAEHQWPAGVEPVAWDTRSALQLAGPVDAVVQLTGAPIARRWSPNVRQELRRSRIAVAERLVDWIASQAPQSRPKAFTSASAVGYYGVHPPGTQAEGGPPGQDFLAQLCADWEDAARHAEMLGVRVVILRFGIVLHPDGGALARMRPAFRLGLGGPLGTGAQPFPWVARDDVARAISWSLGEAKVSDAYNLVAPQEVSMRGFAQTLASVMHRPAFVRVPAAALRLLFGAGAAEVLLGGQVAPPDRLLRAGFRFAHPDLGEALRTMLRA